MSAGASRYPFRSSDAARQCFLAGLRNRTRRTSRTGVKLLGFERLEERRLLAAAGADLGVQVVGGVGEGGSPQAAGLPNTPPTLTLDANGSSGATANNYQTVFSAITRTPVAIADIDTAITDPDANSMITTLTLVAEGIVNGADEVLTVGSTDIPLGGAGSGATSVDGIVFEVLVSPVTPGSLMVSLVPQTGMVAHGTVQTLLSSTVYQNLAATPTLGSRAFHATVSDGQPANSTSNTATTTVDVIDDQFDFGDLPDLTAGVAPGDYQTLQANGGPHHMIVPTLFLGRDNDEEPDGQPSAAADGDDTSGAAPDDEDGVILPVSITAGQPTSFNVTAINRTGEPATLYGFVDWNGDGQFTGPSESTSLVVDDGALSQTLNVEMTVPAEALLDVDLGVRFRLSTDAGLSATGPATNGEVEDYLVRVLAPQPSDYGDLPDTGAGTGAGNYETLAANGGPSHQVTSELFIGTAIDADLDGQPSTEASGDDSDGQGDDDDGVVIPSSIVAGQPVTFSVNITNVVPVQAFVVGFVDWNNDGDFDDVDETSAALPAPGMTAVDIDFRVPISAVPATPVGARFRLSQNSALGPNGAATSGEVEDYLVQVTAAANLPPTITLDADNSSGASANGYQTTYSTIADAPVNIADSDTQISDPDADAVVTGLFLEATGVTSGSDEILTIGGLDFQLVSGNTGTATMGGVLFDIAVTAATPGRLLVSVLPQTGAATHSAVQSLLSSTTYRNLAAIPTRDAREFQVTVDDGESVNNTSNTATSTINIVDAQLDFGDLPDLTAGTDTGDYQTLLANGGPSHVILPTLFLGTSSDDESDGQPTAAADGDDTAGGTPDDEDGVVLPSSIVAGQPIDFDVTVTNRTGDSATLYAFVDWNGDGRFSGPNESTTVSVEHNSVGQMIQVDLVVPAGARVETDLGVRFRLSTNRGLSANGPADDGEVEDYLIRVAPTVANTVVTLFEPTSTGFVAHFNAAINAELLNLYDTQGAGLGAADASLQGAASGPISGSLLVDPSLTKVTFIKTGEPLAVDEYTATLRSGADAFSSGAGPLDGNEDGTPGDDFLATFTVAAAPENAVTVSIVDFVRGPGQDVNVPANLPIGIPLSISNGAGVRNIQFEVVFDPSLLDIAAVEVGDAMPAGTEIEFEKPDPNRLTVTLASPTPLPADTGTFAQLVATVPGTTGDPNYGRIQMLQIDEVRITEGGAVPLPVIVDAGVQLASYFGDVSGNGRINAADAAQVARVAALLETGFSASHLVDPLILSDITGNRRLNSADASRLAQFAALLPVPEIPPLPLPPAAGLTAASTADGRLEPNAAYAVLLATDIPTRQAGTLDPLPSGSSGAGSLSADGLAERPRSPAESSDWRLGGRDRHRLLVEQTDAAIDDYLAEPLESRLLDETSLTALAQQLLER